MEPWCEPLVNPAIFFFFFMPDVISVKYDSTNAQHCSGFSQCQAQKYLGPATGLLTNAAARSHGAACSKAKHTVHACLAARTMLLLCKFVLQNGEMALALTLIKQPLLCATGIPPNTRFLS